MGRKPLHRALPALADVFGNRRRWDRSADQSRQLFEVLAPLVQRLQRADPAPFYAMRDVARHFGVSVSTVARVYRQLQQKGLLFRIRSSHTQIPSRRLHPRVAVWAVIALPVWLPGFVMFNEWRLFFRRLEQELRRHQFVGDMVFYGQCEELQPDFAARLLERNPDAVVWFCPAPSDRPVMEILADAGVPTVHVADSPSLADAPYRISYRAALEAAVADWEADGIRNVVIPSTGPDETSSTHVADEVLAASRLDVTRARMATIQTDLDAYVNSLATRPGLAVLFDNDIWLHVLANEAPQAMVRLFRRCRVSVTRSLPMRPTLLTGVRLDVLAVDWAALAARVARDINRGPHCAPRRPVICQATWRPRCPATELAASYYRE